MPIISWEGAEYADARKLCDDMLVIRGARIIFSSDDAIVAKIVGAV